MNWELGYFGGLATGFAVAGLVALFVYGSWWSDLVEASDAVRHERDAARVELAADAKVRAVLHGNWSAASERADRFAAELEAVMNARCGLANELAACRQGRCDAEEQAAEWERAANEWERAANELSASLAGANAEVRRLAPASRGLAFELIAAGDALSAAEARVADVERHRDSLREELLRATAAVGATHAGLTHLVREVEAIRAGEGS